jgi:DNA-binding protein HU-beta
MNKSEFVDAVAQNADIPKATASKAVDAMVDVISNALKRGQQVSLVGFGTFLTRDREARQGRNPRTGETIQIKASRVPSFKAGKGLKDAVN